MDRPRVRPTAHGPLPPGRPRDGRIDQSVLEVARRHLATRGFRAMSVAAVADEAGTTRQAVYRRWPDKARLADAALAALADSSRDSARGTPLEALVAELQDFALGVSRPGGLSMVGTMLQDTTDAAMLARYRQRIVAPRRARIRAILERGVAEGLLAADADLEIATTLATGSWYARALAGDAVPVNWPERTARLVLSACSSSDVQTSRSPAASFGLVIE